MKSINNKNITLIYILDVNIMIVITVKQLILLGSFSILWHPFTDNAYSAGTSPKIGSYWLIGVDGIDASTFQHNNAPIPQVYCLLTEYTLRSCFVCFNLRVTITLWYSNNVSWYVSCTATKYGIKLQKAKAHRIYNNCQWVLDDQLPVMQFILVETQLWKYPDLQF